MFSRPAFFNPQCLDSLHQSLVEHVSAAGVKIAFFCELVDYLVNSIFILFVDVYFFFNVVDQNVGIKKQLVLLLLESRVKGLKLLFLIFFRRGLPSLLKLSFLLSLFTTHHHTRKSLVHVFYLEVRTYIHYRFRRGLRMGFLYRRKTLTAKA
jgi:hypothetical protein